MLCFYFMPIGCIIPNGFVQRMVCIYIYIYIEGHTALNMIMFGLVIIGYLYDLVIILIIILIIGLICFFTINRRQQANRRSPDDIHVDNLNRLNRQHSINNIANNLPLIKLNSLNQRLITKISLLCPICQVQYVNEDTILILPCDPRYIYYIYIIYIYIFYLGTFFM